MRGDEQANRTGNSEYAQARRRTRDMNTPKASNWTEPEAAPRKVAEKPSKAASSSKSAKAEKANTKNASSTYAVKSGDNLYSIAKRNGVSLEALKKANPGKGDRLQPGDKIVIPGAAAAASKSNSKASSKSSSKKSSGTKKRSKRRR